MVVFRKPRETIVLLATPDTHQRAPVSRPTLRRSTPIRTTVLRFVVRLDAEGAISVRLVA